MLLFCALKKETLHYINLNYRNLAFYFISKYTEKKNKAHYIGYFY